ncbi:hypothetical protein ACFW6K_07740 [Streptomyces sp. NPDC058733]|uniref:hypothetical protein n=1 Tax=Streptomyces sp. NPDC058733 TaxID=3346614 RepID=UPI0036C469C9
MIRRSALAGALLATASLLLTACSGTEDTAAPAAATHPVFDQKLDRQVFLALRRTQQERNVAFTQTITFVSKKGRAVQTVSGRMNFAEGTGAATTKWELSKGLPEDIRDTVLGLTPGKGNAAASGNLLVDRQAIRYRAGTAAYWLEYRSGDAGPYFGDNSIDSLRGAEAPIGGTLVEGLGATEAESGRPAGSGRVYQAQMPSSTAWDVFPTDLRDHLRIETDGPGAYRSSDPLPARVTVDGQGRITQVHADFSQALHRQDGVFKDMTSLTIDLRLTGHGTAQPAMKPYGPVRAARKAVLGITSVKRGQCIDFNTGQRHLATVVDVPCTGPHDGRVFAQKKLGTGTYPGYQAAKDKAMSACRTAYGTAPRTWTSEAAEPGVFWVMRSSEGEWNEDGGHATCYVITTKGTADKS